MIRLHRETIDNLRNKNVRLSSSIFLFLTLFPAFHLKKLSTQNMSSLHVQKFPRISTLSSSIRFSNLPQLILEYFFSLFLLTKRSLHSTFLSKFSNKIFHCRRIFHVLFLSFFLAFFSYLSARRSSRKVTCFSRRTR